MIYQPLNFTYILYNILTSSSIVFLFSLKSFKVFFLGFLGLLNIVVDVAFKLLIDYTELVDNEFKLVNIVVDVAFKLFIDDD